MSYIARWVTPPMSPQRFDTQFFSCLMPHAQEGVHDGYESIESIWITAKDALERNREGAIRLILPTERTLNYLSRFELANHFLEHHHVHLSGIGDNKG